MIILSSYLINIINLKINYINASIRIREGRDALQRSAYEIY